MENQKIIIALDGHSSCGKSTFARRIAHELAYSYIDSGAMYRAVTLACMEEGLFNSTDEPAIESIETLLNSIQIKLRFNPELQETETYLNDRMVERFIRSMEVSGHVSYIAAISSVRRKMVEYQRRLGVEKAVVMDGRDIGTVVFPQAELKIFLTASLEVRTMRRYREMIEKGMQVNIEEVMQNLEKRDHIDSSRSDSPLIQADDAIILDNSEMQVDDQMVWFREVFHKVITAIHGSH